MLKLGSAYLLSSIALPESKRAIPKSGNALLKLERGRSKPKFSDLNLTVTILHSHIECLFCFQMICQLRPLRCGQIRQRIARRFNFFRQIKNGRAGVRRLNVEFVCAAIGAALKKSERENLTSNRS